MPAGDTTVYPHASRKLRAEEYQGGFTSPGSPLIADSIVVDAHTPIGSADVRVSLPVNKSKYYLLYLLAGGAVAYFILRQ